MPRRNRKKGSRPGRNRTKRARQEGLAQAQLEQGGVPSATRQQRAAPPSADRSGVLRCLNGKIGFRTEALAVKRLGEIRAKGPQRDRPMPVRAYRCMKCPFWHITAQTLTERHGKGAS